MKKNEISIHISTKKNTSKNNMCSDFDTIDYSSLLSRIDSIIKAYTIDYSNLCHYSNMFNRVDSNMFNRIDYIDELNKLNKNK